MKPYFVMLDLPNGDITPLTDEDGVIAMFEFQLDAMKAGFNNRLGEELGFEIFESGNGLYY